MMNLELKAVLENKDCQFCRGFGTRKLSLLDVLFYKEEVEFA